MSYNVKLTGDEIEHIAIVLHKNALTNTCERLAQTFSTIMARSPRLQARYADRVAVGHVYPAKEKRR